MACAIVAVALSQATFAAGASGPGGYTEAVTEGQETTIGQRQLAYTKINYAPAASIGLVAGFNDVDPSTPMNCSNAGGCTITADAMVQISVSAGTLWAICLLVDNVLANCPYQGTLPGAGTYVVGNYKGVKPVPKGNHTVRIQVYVSQAATLGSWQVDYRNYKPF